MLIASQYLDWVNEIKQGLSKDFEIKDFKRAKYCLEIEIEEDSEGKIYAKEDIYEIYSEGLTWKEPKSLNIPIEPGTRLTIDVKSTREQEIHPYRELISGLMYAAVATRPDIAYVVSACSI